MKTSEILESASFVDMEAANNSRWGRDDALDQIRKVWSVKSFYIRDPDGELDQRSITNMLKDSLWPSNSMGYTKQTKAQIGARQRFSDKELKVSVSKGRGKDGSVAWKVTVNHTRDSAITRINEMVEAARAWAKKHAKPKQWRYTSHISDDDVRDAYKVIDTLSPEVQRELRIRMRG